MKQGWRPIIPKFQDELSLTSSTLELLEDAKAKLSVIAKKVVLCDLVGLSCQEYNVNSKEFKPQHCVINNSVLTVNNSIDTMNNTDKLLGVKWS